ncbi:uncharacterized protein LOC129879813 [Solanum dulcamara]|uniref:uncharacterized protein LOC129879813 n=1 Tax=Solanum dulcamara TaxID=45834 RepID=UPI002485C80F|nr:uncharacterized protein LOC129879813 [Solanum dulcamara]
MIHSVATHLTVICLALSLVHCSEPDVEMHNLFKPDDCPRKAKLTDVLTLHYKGTLENGEVFDSSYERNEPFSFQLGIGQVIRGWDKGLLDICEGEKRKLVIPPNLAYGDAAHDKIPAKSTLIFEVECLKVEDGPNPINVFKEIDSDQDGKLSRHEVGEFLKRQLSQAYSQPGAQQDMQDHGSMLDEVFKHEDKDNDGYITRDEFSGPKYDHDEL